MPGWVARTVLGEFPLLSISTMLGMRYSRPQPFGALDPRQEARAHGQSRRFRHRRRQVLAESGGRRRGQIGDLHSTVVDFGGCPQTALPRLEPFTIGWIGTPETAPYLDTIKGALKQVLAKEQHAAAPRRRRAPPAASQRRDPVLVGGEGSQSPAAHACRDHAVAARALGSSGKLRQYMAAREAGGRLSGGVNCDVAKEGVNGFFAITEEEWVGNLERFRGNTQSHLALRSSGAGKLWKRRSPCAPPCRRSPRSCCRRRPCAARASASSRALPSNPIWRAPPRQTTSHHRR